MGLIYASRQTSPEERKITMKQLQGAKEDVSMATYVIVLSQIHSNHVAQSKSKLKQENRRVTLQTESIIGLQAGRTHVLHLLKMHGR